jgi:gas vesicle protein
MAYVSPTARNAQTRAIPPGRPRGAAPGVGSPTRSDPGQPLAARSKGRGSFLAGLGIGIAVGAAVALLLAPQSGADTRRALRRRGRRVRGTASDAWEDLRMELSRAKRALRRRRREAREAHEPVIDEP